jgi:hypothetical protein
MKTTTAAKTLGWISISLAAAELIAPGWLQKKVGTEAYDRLARIFRMREIPGGTGDGSTLGNWSRMASDTVDLVGLAGAVQKRMQQGGVGTALATVAALTALDAMVASGREETKPERRITHKPGPRPRQGGKTVARRDTH